MIAAVTLAAYMLLDLALSVFVAIVWRTRAVAPASLPPAVRARRLLFLRLVPTVVGSLIALAVVAPAFVAFEPVGVDETMGPALAALAITALLQICASTLRSIRALIVTARIERLWLQSSSPLNIDPAMPAFAIDSASPVLALVGVFSPKLVAARTIVEMCSADEIARIAGHERGHLQSRDNLKRWILGSLPDVLHWTAIHHEIAEAWHHAAEDAADDATTGKDALARAELAALLLKVARLAPHPLWQSAIVSPFVEHHGLERRVRRLIQPELEPPAPLAIVPAIAVPTIVLAAVATVSSPSALRIIFEAFEQLVALGR
jgi:Zn-dependent protease with chaperone function